MSTVSIDPNAHALERSLKGVRACIVGLEGTSLTPEEVALFQDMPPFGFIVFARNLSTPQQVKSLTQTLREVTNRPHIPILIDQEGGRVARLKPPHWPALPAVGQMVQDWTDSPDALADALRLHAKTIGIMLSSLGITVNCAPMMDVRHPKSHSGVIGDRAFSEDPSIVTYLGQVYADSLRMAGVLPVIKHLPGHGRAQLDSHTDLPHVDADFETLDASDFVPFKAMASELMAMTAHIVFSQIDAAHPATTSSKVIHTLIRQHLGVTGLLMSDDLTMEALSGSPAERTRACLSAGCDIALYCNGTFEDRRAALEAAPVLAGEALTRASRVVTHLSQFKHQGHH